MSTHAVSVVRLGKIEKHGNADTLGIVRIHGYTCVVRLTDWKEGDFAAYIEPDYVVPDRPEFAFLGKEERHRRIRVKRLRGVMSHGLLMPAPVGSREGDNVIGALGVKRYEPPEPTTTRGEDERGPKGYFPVYDLESLRRWPDVLQPQERVIITEKIHGCSCRVVWTQGRLWVGSHRRWKKPPPPGVGKSFWRGMRELFVALYFWVARLWGQVRPKPGPTTVWWQAIKRNLWTETWCRAHPGMVLYGEVFGQVQDLKYGAGRNDVFFRAFDVLRNGEFVDADEFWKLDFPEGARVPLLYDGPFSMEKAEALAKGQSTLATHLREGVVVKPAVERRHEEIGRVALKLVSDDYLERS